MQLNSKKQIQKFAGCFISAKHQTTNRNSAIQINNISVLPADINLNECHLID